MVCLPSLSVQVTSTIIPSLSGVVFGLVQSPPSGVTRSSSAPTQVMLLVMPLTGATVVISHSPGFRFGMASFAPATNDDAQSPAMPSAATMSVAPMMMVRRMTPLRNGSLRAV